MLDLVDAEGKRKERKKERKLDAAKGFFGTYTDHAEDTGSSSEGR